MVILLSEYQFFDIFKDIPIKHLSLQKYKGRLQALGIARNEAKGKSQSPAN
jgi:hypothetical protein